MRCRFSHSAIRNQFSVILTALTFYIRFLPNNPRREASLEFWLFIFYIYHRLGEYYDLFKAALIDLFCHSILVKFLRS